jgi:membrane-bound lytic murein transglycosylase A
MLNWQVSLAVTILIVAAIAIAVYFLSPSSQKAERLVLEPMTFASLEGWPGDGIELAFSAFKGSCDRLVKAAPDSKMGGSGEAGLRSDWQPLCEKALAAGAPTTDSAKQFFEESFTPLRATNDGDESGLFTGYYEAELKGSRTRSDAFPVPLYPRPADLVMVDLGVFKDEWKGQRIGGRVVDGALAPFETRAEIMAGALEGKVTPLVYVSDPVDAFFLDIQGSGRVTLDDGKVIRVSYDAQNGRALTMIGRVLADRGAIERKKVSMQTIRAWLAANPGSATEVMNTNASYVFFREVEVSDPNIGPPGAQSVPLTPGHSLAVDRKFHALGVPVWLDTTTPELGPDKPSKPLRRLFVAQDTGGAIRGPVRGDTFWGFGKEAADIAGEMKQMGSMTLLLPNPVAARLAEAK